LYSIGIGAYFNCLIDFHTPENDIFCNLINEFLYKKYSGREWGLGALVFSIQNSAFPNINF